MGEAVPPCKLPIFRAFPHVNEPPPGPKPTTDETESGVRKSCCFNAPPALLRLSGGPTANLSRFPWSGGPTVNLSRFPSLGWSCGYSLVFSGVLVVLRSISRVFHPPAGPAVNLSCFLEFWWSYGKSLAFSVVWWSYGTSLAVSVVVRWLPVAPRWFKSAPRALLHLSGGPTTNLSRFPWSGGPTLNLSRFSVPRLVLRSISRISVVW